MQLKQLELAGGGTLTVYLRDCCERMPNVFDRPLVLVVPGGGYTHVSAREGDPVALQFAAAGYHTAVLDYVICEKAKDYMPLRQLAGLSVLCDSTRPSGISCRKKLPCAAFQRAATWPFPVLCWTFPAKRPSPGPMRSFWAIRWSRQGSMPTAAALCSWRAAPTQRHSRCSGWRIRSRRRRRRCSYGPPWRMPPFRWRTL